MGFNIFDDSKKKKTFTIIIFLILFISLINMEIIELWLIFYSKKDKNCSSLLLLFISYTDRVIFFFLVNTDRVIF